MRARRAALKRLRTGFEALLAISFAVFIASQLAMVGANLQAGRSLPENRRLARWPDKQTMANDYQAWRQGIEQYVNDYAPLRPQLTRMMATGAYHIFGESVTQTGIAGRDGWLFNGDHYEIGVYRRFHPYGPEELRRFELLFRTVKDWLAARGIAFIFVMAPDKSEMLPQFMPARINRGPGPARGDQILDAARRAGVETVDPRPALKAAMEKGEKVYFTQDTHWSQWGGYLAYREIIESAARLIPGLQPARHEGLRLDYVPHPHADLRGMLGDPYFLPVYQEPLVRWDGWTQTTRKDAGDIAPPASGYRMEGAGKLRMLMFADSFGDAIADFFTADFGDVSVVKNNVIYPEAVIREKPDLVVLEIVQRDGELLIYGMEVLSDMFRERLGIIPAVYLRHGRGEVKVDDTAMIGKAWSSNPAEGGEGYMLYGPYEALQPGKWRVTLRLKRLGGAGALALADVVFSQGRSTLARREVTPADFPKPGEWVDFVMEFQVPQGGAADVEYRLLTRAGVDISADSVTITRLD